MDPLRLSAKSRPEDHIRVSIENRFQKRRDVLRVVFEIGILNDDDFTGCLLERRPQGRAFALIVTVAKRANLARR